MPSANVSSTTESLKIVRDRRATWAHTLMSPLDQDSDLLLDLLAGAGSTVMTTTFVSDVRVGLILSC